MSILDGARDSRGRVRCARCGKPFADKDVQVDHIHPEAEGGSHDPVNLQVLCAPKVGGGCHRLKSREEAKRRARMKKAAERNLLRIPLSVLAAGTGGWGIAFVLTDNQQAYLDQSQTVATWVGIAGLGLGAAYALAHARIVPDVQDAEKVADDGADDRQRLLKRVAEGANLAIRPSSTSGTIISEMRSDGSVIIGYAGTGFPAHVDTKRADFGESVNMTTDMRWRAEWDGGHDRVLMIPRPELPKRINHPGFEKKRNWWTLPVAPGCEINLKVTSHVLVIGRTNMGKTALMRALVSAGSDSAKKGQVELVLMDPKRVELVGYRGWPGVRKVLTVEKDLWQAPLDLKAEMDERHRLFEEEGVPLSSHKPILVVVDEYEQYVIRMTDYWLNESGLKRPGQKVPPPVQAMASLLAMARKCNIHIIIGTQRPDASWFGGTARDNLAARIGVGPLSASAQKMLWGEGHSDIGRDIPDTAKGRATVQLGDGEFEEIQTYWVPDPGDSDGTNTQEDWDLLALLQAA
jgi:hypothetical protein